MKAVLLSIRPEWCDLIVKGKKIVDVRKTLPKLETPFKVYIYCTKDRSKIGWLRVVPGKGWQRLDGSVIGEFICDKIWELAPLNHAPDDVEEMACMDRSSIVRYLNRCHGWAWHISDFKLYDKPMKLKELCTHCGDCCTCRKWDTEKLICRREAFGIERPPQSWCYAEVDG